VNDPNPIHQASEETDSLGRFFELLQFECVYLDLTSLIVEYRG
jgi:hypothetical protein